MASRATPTAPSVMCTGFVPSRARPRARGREREHADELLVLIDDLEAIHQIGLVSFSATAVESLPAGIDLMRHRVGPESPPEDALACTRHADVSRRHAHQRRCRSPRPSPEQRRSHAPHDLAAWFRQSSERQLSMFLLINLFDFHDRLLVCGRPGSRWSFIASCKKKQFACQSRCRELTAVG